MKGLIRVSITSECVIWDSLLLQNNKTRCYSAKDSSKTPNKRGNYLVEILRTWASWPHLIRNSHQHWQKKALKQPTTWKLFGSHFYRFKVSMWVSVFWDAFVAVNGQWDGGWWSRGWERLRGKLKSRDANQIQSGRFFGRLVRDLLYSMPYVLQFMTSTFRQRDISFFSSSN